MKRFGSLAALLAVVLVAGACGRSSSTATRRRPPPAARPRRPPPAATGPGDFGTLKKVCGPGKHDHSRPTRASRPTAIDIATSSDPGFSGRPGLNQEIFDAGEVFVEVVQRRGRHQRPQDHAPQVRRRALQLRRADQEGVRRPTSSSSATATCSTTTPARRDRLSCLLPADPDLHGDASKAATPTSRCSRCRTGRRSTRSAPFNYVAQKFPDATKSVVTMTGNIERDAARRRAGHRSRQAARLDRQGEHPVQRARRADVGARSRSRSRTRAPRA